MSAESSSSLRESKSSRSEAAATTSPPPPVPAPAQRKLATLQLLLKVRQARAEHAELKATVHEEVDLYRESGRAELLRAELERLSVSTARLDARLCYGLPPHWRDAGSDGAWAAAAHGGEWASGWLSGSEVVYTAGKTSADSLAVSHHEQPVRLLIYSRPFAMGGLRQAFYARDAAGGRFVLKRALIESSKLQKRVLEVHADAEAAALSMAVAEAFTASCAAKGQHLSVAYLPASVVILAHPAAPGGKAVYLKEPWLDVGGCKWTKWTRNDGHIMPDGAADAGMQAFAHFSLHFLRPRLGFTAMVLDAQGIQHSRGAGLAYTLTDPALCSSKGAYGQADMGATAIQAFLDHHTCGCICSRLGCGGCGTA
ncbi:hypothetical protein ABPG75_012011 [Micractinium tetrahymenae]